MKRKVISYRWDLNSQCLAWRACVCPIALLLHNLRPCYTKQFFLQLATQQTMRCKLQEKNSRVTPQFATAIVALRVARKVERTSTFRKVAIQVAYV